MNGDGLIYKCVKEVVIHQGRKETPFVLGKTYHVTKKELYDGSGLYRYFIKHPEKEFTISPLYLNLFFSKVEKEDLK